MKNPGQKSDKLNMTDKEKADCLLELHKVQLDHFMQTRDIELKVDIALWSLIAASGSFLYNKIHLVGPLSWLIYSLVTLCIFIGHMFLWKMPIQNSEDIDDHFINQYRSKVEKLTGVSIEAPPPKRPRLLWLLIQNLRKNGWSWILAGTGITLTLLAAVGLLLSQ